MSDQSLVSVHYSNKQHKEIKIITYLHDLIDVTMVMSQERENNYCISMNRRFVA
jgi:hypothetical protein